MTNYAAEDLPRSKLAARPSGFVSLCAVVSVNQGVDNLHRIYKFVLQSF